ncbi:MAG: hypothetical protein LBU16_00440 [Treponema sp.]|jgi:hypothetical protein|nr:hypothetical protein [Treponema sp.]
MKITADLAAGRLALPETVFPVSNRVRTIRDGTRESHEVTLSIPDRCPYDPQPFPKGLWHITGLDWQKEKNFDPRTYGPVKIRTDAWQWVNVWQLDGYGDYLRETDERVKDTCYWLHYSAFSSTLGCIRLASPKDAESIANLIARALDREPVELEVT